MEVVGEIPVFTKEDYKIGSKLLKKMESCGLTHVIVYGDENTFQIWNIYRV